MTKRKTTNEWEFQGQILSWLNDELKKRPGLKLERATQEPSKHTPKRNDLVVWSDRASEQAFLCLELKTPATSLADPKLFTDAEAKAKRWGAPYFCIWNMREAELYRTPEANRPATPDDRILVCEPDSDVKSVEDWLKPKVAKRLRLRAVELLDIAWADTVSKGRPGLTIEATVFVDRLAQWLAELRNILHPALASRCASSRAVRAKIRAMAAAQGFLGFVDDVEEAFAGQYAYRLLGQILFYFALRRKISALPPMAVAAIDTIPESLRQYWDAARRYDYEALFQPTDLDQLIPVPAAGGRLVRRVVDSLASYDWNRLRDDVLGSVFEHLIPRHEQMLLGQFYTPASVADVLVSFAVGDRDCVVLDPGCGSGTFLMRAYDCLRSMGCSGHSDLLSRLWGFDISPFACELAAINLFRQDLSVFDNFPRVVQGSYFERSVGQEIPFPPARQGGGEKVTIAIPKFDAVVGNPPFLRSQHQDDLDSSYKRSLFSAATANGVSAASKTDLFGFFLYKSIAFLKPGARIGFVTSASWLTADFAAPLQRLLLEKLRLVAVIGSEAESFFSQVEINTILLVAEMRDETPPRDDEVLRFVTLKSPLSALFPASTTGWTTLQEFSDDVENATESREEEGWRLKVVDAATERKSLQLSSARPRNWSIFLRAPMSFWAVLGES